ncbi:MAG: dTMP kinase [candidate division WOR-3 bacterium]
MRGFFLVIEGIEGSGKTTLARGLAERLESVGHPVILTREPGGTPVGERIRELLLYSGRDISPWSEFFLFLAARREHTFSVIRPALLEGKIVISDRYSLSSFAYQGYGRGLPLKILSRLNKFATGGLVPHLTIIADLPVEEAFARIGKERDRIEAEGAEFHERVRQGYLRMARRAGKRIRVIDTRKPPEEVLEEAMGMVAERLNRFGI